jgi:hypothetical protein
VGAGTGIAVTAVSGDRTLAQPNNLHPDYDPGISKLHDNWQVDDDVRVWIDSGGGITIKAVTPEGDPVEISAAQARKLAAALSEAAELDEAE